MNPNIENELRLNVMKHAHFGKMMLKQPIDKNVCTIKLQPLQILSKIINTKSIFSINKIS